MASRATSTDPTSVLFIDLDRFDRVGAAVKEPFRVAGREVFIGASVGIAVDKLAGVLIRT